MKDFTVEFTITIPITAHNEEQAEERANLMQEWVKLEAPKTAKWIGDMDIGEPTTEENQKLIQRKVTNKDSVFMWIFVDDNRIIITHGQHTING